jgi:hypothetical protein
VASQSIASGREYREDCENVLGDCFPRVTVDRFYDDNLAIDQSAKLEDKFCAESQQTVLPHDDQSADFPAAQHAYEPPQALFGVIHAGPEVSQNLSIRPTPRHIRS